MSNNFQNFYKENIKQINNIREFTVSDRFVEKDDFGEPILNEYGEPVLEKFKAKALKPSEVAKLSAKIDDIENTSTKDAIDATVSMVTQSLVYPNLNNADLQSNYGVMSAEALIDEMFTNAELTEIVKNVSIAINGSEDFNDMVNEVKNY